MVVLAFDLGVLVNCCVFGFVKNYEGEKTKERFVLFNHSTDL